MECVDVPAGCSADVSWRTALLAPLARRKGQSMAVTLKPRRLCFMSVLLLVEQLLLSQLLAVKTSSQTLPYWIVWDLKELCVASAGS